MCTWQSSFMSMMTGAFLWEVFSNLKPNYTYFTNWEFQPTWDNVALANRLHMHPIAYCTSRPQMTQDPSWGEHFWVHGFCNLHGLTISGSYIMKWAEKDESLDFKGEDLWDWLIERDTWVGDFKPSCMPHFKCMQRLLLRHTYQSLWRWQSITLPILWSLLDKNPKP